MRISTSCQVNNKGGKMELEVLLEKNEQLKLRVLIYIQTKSEFIPLNDVLLTIGISELKLKKLIKELNSDLQQVNHQFYIFFSKTIFGRILIIS